MKAIQNKTVERGILTSVYKREIKNNIVESKRSTLSKMKSMVESHQATAQSQAGTILQVSLFAFAIILSLV